MIPASFIFESARADAMAREADRTLASFFIFLGIGGGAALSYVALVEVLVPAFADVPSWWVSALCYASFVLPVYMLHRRFSFRSDAQHAKALPRYVAVQIGALLLAALFSYLAYGMFGLKSTLAALIVIGLTSAANFIILRLWAFASDQ